MSKKICLILETLNFSNFIINDLKKDFIVKLGMLNLEKDEYNNVEVIFSRLNFILNKEFLYKYPGLKTIISPATGTSHVDFDYINQKKINFISLKGHTKFLNSITPTSELTIWHILSLSRKILASSTINKKNNESKWHRENFIGEDLYREKIGIIGLGRLGKMVGKILLSFSSEIYFYDINLELKENNFKRLDFDELLSTCKIISIHVPHNKKTNNLITTKQLNLMKDDGILINTSRGGIINESDIYNHLCNNKKFRVGLDVFEYEHNPNPETLINYENLKDFSAINPLQLSLTPHLGGASIKAMQRTEEYCYKIFKQIRS